jgi:hypothetical protein
MSESVTTDREAMSESLGRIDVRTVPLPANVLSPSATYTVSGKVFVLYRAAGDPIDRDWYRAAIVEDDGSGFTEIFSGPILQQRTANGIRHMPFSDDRRMLLGDYVLECAEPLGTATSAELVPVRYPWDLTSDPLTSHHWSEIIVSPDDHIAWTILRTDMSAVVGLGRLIRTGDHYVIADPVVISSADALRPDPERVGWFTTHPMLGGEVKQFVRGGSAISSVGDGGGALTDSVIQDLTVARIEAITRTPGYDETTILSPDERLGIVMTSRASTGTDPAFLGLLPRPHANLVTMDLAWVVYLYVVDGVRRFRPGSIGPVLIDVARSMTEPGYRGIALDRDESWVYCSPMSWHPSGRTAMWMEMLRGSGAGDEGATLRIRIAELLDRTAPRPVDPVPTPSHPPYALAGDEARELLRRRATTVPSGRIAGAHSGWMEFTRSSDGRGTFSARSRYVNYSDDGRGVYNGFERAAGSMADGVVYEADLELVGECTGEMRLRAEWSGVRDGTRLLFDDGADGKPRSRGFARFGDTVARVDDLVR